MRTNPKSFRQPYTTIGPGVSLQVAPITERTSWHVHQKLDEAKLEMANFPLSGLAASGMAMAGDLLVWNGAWVARNWVNAPFGVGQAPVASGGLTIALSGTPFDPANSFVPNTGPALRLVNTQNASGGMSRLQFRDPPSWEFGVYDESCPFDLGTVSAAVSGRGNCLYWNDLRQGTNFLDQNRMRLDGDGQLTIRTANKSVTAAENNLRLVHTPVVGLVASGGIGVGIQFGGLARDFGTINAIGATVDTTGGLIVSRFDFYTANADGVTTTSMTLSGDGTCFIPGKISVGGTCVVGTSSRLKGAVSAGDLTCPNLTASSLVVTGTTQAQGTLAATGLVMCTVVDAVTGAVVCALQIGHQLGMNSPDWQSGFGVSAQFWGCDANKQFREYAEIRSFPNVGASGSLGTALSFWNTTGNVLTEQLRIRNSQVWVINDFLHSGTNLGFYNSGPVAQQAVGAAATDLASVITLANNLRAAALAVGLFKN